MAYANEATSISFQPESSTQVVFFVFFEIDLLRNYLFKSINPLDEDCYNQNSYKQITGHSELTPSSVVEQKTRLDQLNTHSYNKSQSQNNHSSTSNKQGFSENRKFPQIDQELHKNLASSSKVILFSQNLFTFLLNFFQDYGSKQFTFL